MITPPAAEPLDLAKPRDIGALLSTAWRVLTQNFLVIFTVTLLIYAPLGLLVTGVALDGFDPEAADAGTAAALGAALALSLVIPALITAIHVVLVGGLSRGDEISVRYGLVGAFPRLVVLLAAALMYTGAVVAGFLALIVPGIFLAVRLYFAPQSVIVDNTSATGALRNSWELVRGQWWFTFGAMLLAGLLAGIPIQIVDTIALEALGEGGAYVAVSVVLGAVGVSYTALFAALLFFSLRARRQSASVAGPVEEERPAYVPPGETQDLGGLGAPERPEGLPPRRDL